MFGMFLEVKEALHVELNLFLKVQYTSSQVPSYLGHTCTFIHDYYYYYVFCVRVIQGDEDGDFLDALKGNTPSLPPPNPMRFPPPSQPAPPPPLGEQ